MAEDPPPEPPKTTWLHRGPRYWPGWVMAVIVAAWCPVAWFVVWRQPNSDVIDWGPVFSTYFLVTRIIAVVFSAAGFVMGWWLIRRPPYASSDDHTPSLSSLSRRGRWLGALAAILIATGIVMLVVFRSGTSEDERIAASLEPAASDFDDGWFSESRPLPTHRVDETTDTCQVASFTDTFADASSDVDVLSRWTYRNRDGTIWFDVGVALFDNAADSVEALESIGRGFRSDPRCVLPVDLDAHPGWLLFDERDVLAAGLDEAGPVLAPGAQAIVVRVDRGLVLARAHLTGHRHSPTFEDIAVTTAARLRNALTPDSGATQVVSDLRCGNNTPAPQRGVDPSRGVVTLATSYPGTSDPGDVFATDFEQSLQGAVDWINRLGGIDGCRFELEVLDSRVDGGLRADIETLIEDDSVWGFVALAGVADLVDARSLLESAGTPVWGAQFMALPPIREIYSLTPPPDVEALACLNYLADTGSDTVAFIGATGGALADRYAIPAGYRSFDDTVDKIRTAADTRGTELVAVIEVDAADEFLSNEVGRLRDLDVDSIIADVDYIQLRSLVAAVDRDLPPTRVCADTLGAQVGSVPYFAFDAPPGAAEGILAAASQGLDNFDDELTAQWHAMTDGTHRTYLGLEAYSYAIALFALWERLDGDLSYDNFHETAENLTQDPIRLPTLPTLTCGPPPAGHSCASTAAIVRYTDNAATEWEVIRGFDAPG